MANSLFILLLFLFAHGCLSAIFTVTNNCGYTVWPATLSNAGNPALSPTGFALQTGESKTLNALAAWSGRLWGRTLCSTDGSGKFICGTGDCGSGKMECAGGGAATSATLAEFTLGGGMDYYDVSLVDGYNIPMLVVPQGGGGGKGGCGTTGCVAELNGVCPSELKVMRTGSSEGVACKSACEAFGAAEFCCSGAHSNPNTCKPSAYSEFFKKACPKAYSYAYDDATSIFTCAAANYLITFCPTTTTSTTATDTTTTTGRQKSSDQSPNTTSGQPGSEGSLPRGEGGGMLFLNGYDFGGVSAAATDAGRGATVLAAAIAALAWLIL